MPSRVIHRLTGPFARSMDAFEKSSPHSAPRACQLRRHSRGICRSSKAIKPFIFLMLRAHHRATGSRESPLFPPLCTVATDQLLGRK